MGYNNEFSWSFSRKNIFETCARQYYFNYYGSHNGWNTAPGTLSHEVYKLKKMTNQWGWLGSVVHKGIAEYLNYHLSGKELDLDKWIEETLRTGWQQSLDTEGYRPARVTKLYEHCVEDKFKFAGDLEKIITDAKDLANVMKDSLLLVSAKRALAADNSAWYSVEQMNFLHIEGVKVWAVMDFAFMSDKGKLCVVDWKTGKKKEAHKLQLAVYAAYVNKTWGIPLEDIYLIDYYLKTDEVVQHNVIEEDVEKLRVLIAQSSDDMCNLIVPGNIALPIENFKKVSEDLTKPPCSWCNFRQLCSGQIELGGSNDVQQEENERPY